MGKALGLRLLAVVLLQGAVALSCAAAEPGTAGSSGASLKPADSSTPTAPASDNDDRQITAQIKQALLDDKSFSVLAQHVQIATNKDAVILKGAVRSEEVDSIEALAARFGGSRQIDNQLTVAAQ